MTEKGYDFWGKAIGHFEEHPLDFGALETTHEIKSLELAKFGTQEIRNRVYELQQRHANENDGNSKNWMENEYRMFLWSVFVFSDMEKLTPTSFVLSFLLPGIKPLDSHRRCFPQVTGRVPIFLQMLPEI